MTKTYKRKPRDIIRRLKDEVSAMREFMERTIVPHDECLGTGGIETAKDCRPCKGAGCISVWKLYQEECG